MSTGSFLRRHEKKHHFRCSQWSHTTTPMDGFKAWTPMTGLACAALHGLSKCHVSFNLEPQNWEDYRHRLHLHHDCGGYVLSD